tara:strand:- start:30 stop:698 length:669 start_codon:yes stop_codon:yes gene_type:complete
MTYRELINQVLIRLREDTITSDWSGAVNDSITISAYQKVIGSLVNDSKRNIESFHDWMALRETVDVSTVAGTKNYNLSSGQELQVLDVTNQSTGYTLKPTTKHYINTQKYPTESTGEPGYYCFNGVDTSGNLKVDFTPIPTEAQTISFDIVKYQDNLTLAATTLKIPAQPVILGAWARALAERGEDGGTQSSLAAEEAAASLRQSIIIDGGHNRYEQDWYVV